MVAARAAVDERDAIVEQSGRSESFDGAVLRSVGAGSDVHRDGEVEFAGEADVDLGGLEGRELRTSGCHRHRHERSVVGKNLADPTDVLGEGDVAFADPSTWLVLRPAVREHGPWRISVPTRRLNAVD